MLYLDYSANTPVDEAVLQCFCEAERRYPGNANAHHQAGTAAKAAINEATRSIARCLGTSSLLRWSIRPSAAVWRPCKSRGTKWSCWTSVRTARWTLQT